MKIGIVFYDMQEFGGLEEYASALAIGLKESGHQVCVFSCAWIPPDNQYLVRLRKRHIEVIQPPKWVSLLASDWSTKEKIIAIILRLCAPLIFLLSLGLAAVRRRSFGDAFQSARNWLQGRLGRIISPDRRQGFTELMLKAWSRSWKPEVLHLQGYTTNLLYVIEWASKQRIPVVYEEHQTPDPMFDWWQNFKDSINKAMIVVAVSEKSAQGLRDVCKVSRPIVVRNPLMVDPLLDQGQQKHTIKQNQPITVSTLARLYETKGLNFLLEAVVKVRRKYPNTIFRVYGDGPLREDLMIYAAKLGLDGSRIFAGAFNHNDLPEIMAETDIFLMSSILEGQPLALVEAMAYGCPIIATCVGGIPELIQDGVNGFLCPPADPACLADKVCTFIEQPDLREWMGQAARHSYVEGPFQPRTVSQGLAEIYTRAIRMHNENIA